jgi:hypothetical protein
LALLAATGRRTSHHESIKSEVSVGGRSMAAIAACDRKSVGTPARQESAVIAADVALRSGPIVMMVVGDANYL